ncbi:MAG: HYR domain-containing protein [Bacteroidetes bacterium]|nr:HYR domain-containing protein [Bacteroidota bacterium]
MIHFQANNSPPTGNGTLLSWKPNIRMTFAPGGCPDPPVSLSAGAISCSRIHLDFTRNAANNNIVIVADKDNTFTTPSGNPPAAGGSFAGGTLVYNGGGSSCNHGGLDYNQPYYYMAFSWDHYGYSSGIPVSANTSQTVTTIGTGTFYQRQPFGPNYGYERTASVYSLQDVCQAGTITQLGWYVQNPQTTDIPLKIYLKTITSSTLPLTTWASLIDGATLVYDGIRQFNTGGWTNIDISDYYMDPGNLLVLCETNTGGSGAPACAYFSYSYAYGTNETFYSNNSPPMGNGTIFGNRPNLKLSISPVGPCVPVSLSATAYNSDVMNLSFTPNTVNDHVLIVYDMDSTFTTPSGAPPAVGQPFAGGTLIYNGTGSSYNHTGLTANYVYYYKAFSYDGNAYSPMITAQDTIPALNVVTVGTGTQTSNSPFNVFRGYERSASLFLHDEIRFGKITKLAWYVADPKPTEIPIKIYLYQHHASECTPQTWSWFTDNATLVYEGTVKFDKPGWRTFDITDFNYVNSGSSNLFVLCEANYGDTGSTVRPSFWWTSAYKKQEISRDNNHPPTGVGYVFDQRPNIQITFEPDAPDNPAGLSATALSTSQIDLTFAKNTTNDKVVIVFNQNNGFTTPSGAPPAVGQPFAGGTVLYIGKGTFYHHTGLTSNKIYYYKAFSYNNYKYSSGLNACDTTLQVTVTIGAGISDQPEPLGADMGYKRTAALYTASDVGLYGIITDLYWYVNIPHTTDLPLKIYLKKTQSDTLVETNWSSLSSGATLVYDATSQFNTAGWVKIDITDFAYCSDNLLVLTEVNYGGEGPPLTPTFCYSWSYKKFEVINGNNEIPTWDGFLSEQRPNIRITLSPDICPETPGGFVATAIGTGQIDLSFTHDAQNHEIVIVYDPDNTFTIPSGPPFGEGHPLAGGTVIYRGDGTTYSHTGLAFSQIYYYKAFSYDGSQYSTGLVSSDTTFDPDIVTVGDGTSSQPHPFGAEHGYERSVSIYKADEISQSGIFAKLAWYVETPQPTDIPVRIYLKRTTSDTLTSTNWALLINGASLVYDATLQFNAAGWTTIDITDFSYCSDNLMVLCEANYGGTGNANYPTFRFTSSHSKHEVFSSDNFPPYNDGMVDDNRPNIQFTLADCHCPAVPVSLSATAVSAAQINLAFKPNVHNDSVLIVFNLTNDFSSPSGAPPVVGQSFAGGTLIYNGKGTSFFHSGLPWNEVYYYKAFSYDGSLYSPGITAHDTTFDNSLATIGMESYQQGYPFDAGSGYTRSASLYTNPEIGYYGIVTQLSWYVMTTESINIPIRIYLKPTTDNTLSPTTWASMISDATLVYDDTLSFNKAGWINLDIADFSYCSQNLLVLCEANYGGSGYPSYPTFRYSNYYDKHETFFADDTPPGGNGIVYSSRPNIRIAIKVGDCPEMPASLTATAISVNQIDLSFAPNAANDSVIIVFDEDGTFSQPYGIPPGPGLPFAGGTVLYKGTGTEYHHSGLNPNTTYYYKSFSWNGVNYSDGRTASETTLPPRVVTIEGGNYSQTAPFGVTFGYERSASLYTASEINYFGVITDLGWYNISQKTTQIPTKIYLKKTMLATLPNATWASLISGATLVYDATRQHNTPSWEMINITDFLYGSDNLLVLCETNYGGIGTTECPLFRYTAASSRHEYYTNNQAPPPGIGLVNDLRPNLRIVFVPGGLNTPGSFSATAVSADQINLDFTPDQDLDSVAIAYTIDNTFEIPSGPPPEPGQPFAGGTLIYKGTGTSFNHAGLTPNQVYYYKAFSYDGSQYSFGLQANDTTFQGVFHGPGPISVNADPGECYATVSDLGTPAKDDTCHIKSVSNDKPPNDQYPVGSTIVTWTVIDSCDNTFVCTQLVSVTDNQPPTIICPDSVTLSLDPGQSYTNVMDLGVPNIGDNCGIASVNLSNPTNFRYQFGTQIVTWNVTDIHGNTTTCTQVVTIQATPPPEIVCPDTLWVNVDLGQCYAYIKDLEIPDINGSWGIVDIQSDKPQNDEYPIGTTTVTWTVTDIFGNYYHCTQIINVTDNEPPWIACLDPVITNADLNQCFATISDLGFPMVMDNCVIQTIMSNNPENNEYPVGNTTVTWTVTDYKGNSTQCAQSVKVTDVQIPTITCPQDLNVRADTGKCYATIPEIEIPQAYDICGIQSIVDNNPYDDQFPVGDNIILWTAVDINGNTAQCPLTVTVNDIEYPSVTCPQNISLCIEASDTGRLIPGIAPVTSDNCGISAVKYDISGATQGSGPDDASGTFFRAGISTVTYIVTDVHLNISTCSFTVSLFTKPVPTAGATPQNLCESGSFQLNGSASGGGGGYHYSWQGPDNFSSTDQNPLITNAQPLQSGSYHLVVTDTNQCTSSGDSSVLVTVYNGFNAGSINTTGETIFYNGNPSVISSATEAGGGDGNLLYAWQSSTTSGETGFTDISGTNDASYDPPSGFTTTTWFRRQAKAGGCEIPWTLSAGVWKVTVVNNFEVGSIAANQSICHNTIPALLTSAAPSGGITPYTYQWQRSTNNITFSDIAQATGTTYQPGVLTQTTYYRQNQTSSGNGGTLMTDTITITVFQRPTGVISGTRTTCSGQQDTLIITCTGAGPWAGTLSDGTPFSGSSSPIPVVVTPNSATVYTISTLSDSRCTSIPSDLSGSAVLTLGAPPTSNIIGDTTICQGQSTLLTIHVTGTGPWYGMLSDGNPIYGASSPIYRSVNPGSTFIYSVVYLFDANICFAEQTGLSGSVVVGVTMRPTGTISGTTSICQGESVDLTLHFTGTGPWTGTLSDGTPFSSSSANMVIPKIPAESTTYTISSLTDTHCSALDNDLTSSAVVTVHPRPVGMITGTAAICKGQNVTLTLVLTGKAPWSGTLSDGTGFSGNSSPITINKSPSITTTYTISSLMDNYCISYLSDLSGSAVVNVLTRPTGSVSGSASVCKGQSANLNIAVTGAGPWTGTLSDGSTFSGSASPVLVSRSPLVTTTYTLVSLSDVNCAALAADLSGTVNLTVHPRPTGMISGTTSICNGQPVILEIAVTGNGPWSGTLMNSTPFSGSSSPIQVSVTPAATTTFTIGSLIDANCSALAADLSGTAKVTIKSRPTGVLSGNTTICSGQAANLTLTFTGKSPWTGTLSDGSSFISTGNALNTARSPATTTTYTITSLIDGNCTAFSADLSGSATFIVVNLSTITFNGLPSAVCLYDGPFSLTGGSPAGGVYSGPGVSGGIFNPLVTGPGIFMLTYAITSGGCSGSATAVIQVINSMKSVVTVGAGGDYTTLTGTTGIFNAINTHTLCGNLVVKVISNITEPGTVALNQWLEYGAGGYTVSIVPNDGSEKVLSGNYAGALIR